MLNKSKKNVTTNAAISRQYALDCIPVKNPQIAEEYMDSGELRLQYQVQVRPWFQNIVKKITRKESEIIHRTLDLDSLGSSVWKMIDGSLDVRQIIDAFQSTHQLNQREAEISVTSFLKELGNRGLLAIREK